MELRPGRGELSGRPQFERTNPHCPSCHATGLVPLAAGFIASSTEDLCSVCHRVVGLDPLERPTLDTTTHLAKWSVGSTGDPLVVVPPAGISPQDACGQLATWRDELGLIRVVVMPHPSHRDEWVEAASRSGVLVHPGGSTRIMSVPFSEFRAYAGD